MRDALEAGDVDRLGTMLRDAFEAKKRMNPHIAEHTPIDAMLAHAQEAGASGGKICGAGGGGYLMLYCLPRAPAARARAALEAPGRTVRAVRLVARGRPGPPRGRRLGPLMSRRFVLLDRDGTVDAQTYLVGDKDTDVEAGRRAGVTTVLVLSGEGKAALASGSAPDLVARDLREAASIISTQVRGDRVNPDEVRTRARAYLNATAQTILQVEAGCLEDIVAAAEMLTTCLRGGGKLMICGNGGSAADAQHLATEFVSTLTIDNPRPSIPALALTTDTSLLTADRERLRHRGDVRPPGRRRSDARATS